MNNNSFLTTENQLEVQIIQNLINKHPDTAAPLAISHLKSFYEVLNEYTVILEENQKLREENKALREQINRLKSQEKNN